MDILVIGVFIGYGIILLILIFICYLYYSELKKGRKEIYKIRISINQMNTSLVHQTSKIVMMNKHLAIIGSKLAPGFYKKRDSGKT